MAKRFTTAAAIAAMAMIVGTACGAGAQLMGMHTAHVVINGQDAGRPPVDCSQVRWWWSIKTLKETPGFEAQVNTSGAAAAAKSVQINNLGGFTGSSWYDTTGDATATLEDRTFTISGTAVGFYQDDPSERTTADFTITTDC